MVKKNSFLKGKHLARGYSESKLWKLNFDGKWFKGQGKWAKIDDKQISDISNHMRDIHEQKRAGKDLINKEGIRTAKEFSWENVIAKKFRKKKKLIL